MINYLTKLLSDFQWQGEKLSLIPFFYEGSLIDLESGEKVATIRVGLFKKIVDFRWESPEIFKKIQQELEKRQFKIRKINLFPFCLYVDVINLETKEIEETIFIEMKNNQWYAGILETTFI